MCICIDVHSERSLVRTWLGVFRRTAREELRVCLGFVMGSPVWVASSFEVGANMVVKGAEGLRFARIVGRCR